MRRQLATAAVMTGLVAGTLAGTTGFASAAGRAPADTCNAYSSTCPTPPTSVLPTHLSRHPGNGPGTNVQGVSQSRLPFTGFELTVMVVAGVGAIGAGTILVTTGRRRRSAAH
jgi:hypothetical protein